HLAIPDDARRIGERLVGIRLGLSGMAFPAQIFGAAVRMKDDGDEGVPNPTCDGHGPGENGLHRPPPGPGTSVVSRLSACRTSRRSPACSASRLANIMIPMRAASSPVAATWLSTISPPEVSVSLKSP